MKQRTVVEEFKINKVYKKNSIDIVITPHAEFTGCMAAMVQSIVDNSNDEYNYDIVVLHKEIDIEDIECIKNIPQRKENITIRFYDVSTIISTIKFFKTENTYATTYFRILIPYIMNEYERVLYIDADTIVESDLVELYQQNIEEYCLAAVADYGGNYHCLEKDSELLKYRKKILNMKDPMKYFNAGILLMNTQNIRTNYGMEELLCAENKGKFKQKDQDLLNYFFAEKTLFLDYKYNMLVTINFEKNQYFNQEEKERIRKAFENPYIIHYVGRYKPWIYRSVPYSDEFWKYAEKTPLIRRIESEMGYDLAYENLRKQIRRNKVGIKQVLKLVAESIKVKFK